MRIKGKAEAIGALACVYTVLIANSTMVPQETALRKKHRNCFSAAWQR